MTKTYCLHQLIFPLDLNKVAHISDRSTPFHSTENCHLFLLASDFQWAACLRVSCWHSQRRNVASGLLVVNKSRTAWSVTLLHNCNSKCSAQTRKAVALEGCAQHVVGQRATTCSLSDVDVLQCGWGQQVRQLIGRNIFRFWHVQRLELVQRLPRLLKLPFIAKWRLCRSWQNSTMARMLTTASSAMVRRRSDGPCVCRISHTPFLNDTRHTSPAPTLNSCRWRRLNRANRSLSVRPSWFTILTLMTEEHRETATPKLPLWYGRQDSRQYKSTKEYRLMSGRLFSQAIRCISDKTWTLLAQS